METVKLKDQSKEKQTKTDLLNAFFLITQLTMKEVRKHETTDSDLSLYCAHQISAFL